MLFDFAFSIIESFTTLQRLVRGEKRLQFEIPPSRFMCCSLLYPHIFTNITATFIKITKDSQIAGIRAVRLQKSPSDFFAQFYSWVAGSSYARVSFFVAFASEGEGSCVYDALRQLPHI